MGCGGWQAAMRTLALDPMLLSQFYHGGVGERKRDDARIYTISVKSFRNSAFEGLHSIERGRLPK